MTCMHALMDLIVAEGEYQSATTKSHQFANMLLSRLLLALLDGSEDRVRRGKTQMLAYARAHAPPPRQEASKPAGQHSLPAWSHASSGAHIARRILALLPLLGARFMLSGALTFATMANPFFLRPWFPAGGDGYRICRGLPRVRISAFCPMARTCFWVCLLSIGCQDDPAPTCSLMPIQPSDAPPSHRCQSHCPIRSQTHRPVSHRA